MIIISNRTICPNNCGEIITYYIKHLIEHFN